MRGGSLFPRVHNRGKSESYRARKKRRNRPSVRWNTNEPEIWLVLSELCIPVDKIAGELENCRVLVKSCWHERKFESGNFDLGISDPPLHLTGCSINSTGLFSRTCKFPCWRSSLNADVDFSDLSIERSANVLAKMMFYRFTRTESLLLQRKFPLDPVASIRQTLFHQAISPSRKSQINITAVFLAGAQLQIDRWIDG